METLSSNTSSIFSPSETSISSPIIGETFSSSNSSGILDTLKNVGITTWIILFFILAFLGFNIFVYLAKGTEEITDALNPLLKRLFGITIGTASQVVDVGSEGAKKVVGGTAEVINTGLSAVQELTPVDNVGGSIPQEDLIQKSALNKALNSTGTFDQPDYEPNEATTTVHSGKGKAGWCYIGMDRGFRTCAQVGVNDTCMSGDIFPSQDICMNPNLRP